VKSEEEQVGGNKGHEIWVQLILGLHRGGSYEKSDWGERRGNLGPEWRAVLTGVPCRGPREKRRERLRALSSILS